MGAGAGSSTLGPSGAAAAAAVLGAGAALAAAFAWGRGRGRQLRALDPPTTACRRPFAAYSHGTLVPAGVPTGIGVGRNGVR